MIGKLDKSRAGWWEQAVLYQIYPKSLQDSDGDGVGDLRGILSRLPYLEQLGIDGIWLSPVCQSPQADNGYDISDYCAIDPMFGTMEDMELLIREAKKRGISILMDLVLNHTSWEHTWFQQALRSREDPRHDFYVWQDGDGVHPPNDMQSVFGGPAWTYVPGLGQYYFHQVAPQQPDLNWVNERLRQALCDTIRFWVEKGVEGFRLDVIDQIAKEPDRKITANGPKLHAYLQELSRKAFREPGLLTVGETWSADVEKARRFSALDGSELSMVFEFRHLLLDQKEEKWDPIPLDLIKLKQCFAHWQQGLHGCGWNSLFFNNHDLPRIISRWGDPDTYRVESGKMLATMLYGMEGTPFIYQGEELGMTNIRLPIQAYRDVEIRNFYADRMEKGWDVSRIMESIYRRGRDNARTPMQWNGDAYGGFSQAEPWLPVNENHRQINAEAALQDPESLFYYYQKLIRLRKTQTIFREGSFCLVDPENPWVFAYRRQAESENLLVLCNFTGQPRCWQMPQACLHGEKWIGNYEGFPSEHLRPYEAAMLYYTDKEL